MVLPALQVRVPNPANALLQAERALGARAERRELESVGESRNALRDLVQAQGGLPSNPADQAAFVNQFAQTDPLGALSLRGTLNQQQAQQQQQAIAGAQLVGQVFSGVNDEATYGQALRNLSGLNVDVSKFPTTFDPATVENIRSTAAAVAPPGQPFSLSPGQSRFSGSGQQIASVPPSPTATFSPVSDAQGNIVGQRNSLTGQVVSDPRSSPVGDPQTVFKNANTLRDEFVKQTDDFVEAQTGFQKVQSGAALNTAQGDVSLIFGYMKTIDPGSTVREGEFATAEDTRGVGDQIIALYNRAVSGERLSDDQRQGFVEAARSSIEAQMQGYQQTVSEYTRLAERFDLDPALVVIDRLSQERSAAASPSDISTMSAEQLRGLNLDAMTQEQRDAVAARLTELGL